jgi:hypothetical protein
MPGAYQGSFHFNEASRNQATSANFAYPQEGLGECSIRLRLCLSKSSQIGADCRSPLGTGNSGL